MNFLFESEHKIEIFLLDQATLYLCFIHFLLNFSLKDN